MNKRLDQLVFFSEKIILNKNKMFYVDMKKNYEYNLSIL